MQNDVPPILGKKYSAMPAAARQPLSLSNGRRRPGLVRGFLNTLFSPASALVFSLLGYYSFAGITNAFVNEGSIGGVFIRGSVLAIVTMTFVFSRYSVPTGARFLLFPVILFFLAYLMRLYENFYFSGIYISPGPQIIFLSFMMGGILTSLALSRMVNAARDGQFIFMMSLLCMVFLIGMAFNLGAILETMERRLWLDKINPISMAHTAFAFLIYYLLVFRRSRRLTIEALVFVPLLLFIVVYSRSRGAYIAGAAAVVIYFLLLKGTRRIGLLVGLGIGGSGYVAVFGNEYADIVWRSLESLTTGEDMSAGIRVLAWSGAWEQFRTDPVFGRYALELITQFYPHNIYLEALMAVGFVGSIPLAFHIGMAIRASVGIVRSRKFPVVAVFVAILFFREIFASAFSGSIWGNSGFWITSITVITLWYGRRFRRADGFRAGKMR